MLLFREPFPTVNEKISAVALGTFDGVHIGHRSVINEAVRRARVDDGLAAVWCFSEPPKRFFTPDDASLLNTLDEKISIMESLGVDVLIMPDPDLSLFSITAEDFLSSLRASIAPAHVICGFNYHFGKDAAGTPELLRDFFTPLGIGVTVVPAVLTSDGTPVSSTLIRSKLEREEDVSHLLSK